MVVFGYIRVSSNKQTCEHQKYEIEQYATQHNIHIDKWIMETISSRKPLNKRKLGELLDGLQSDDILIAAEISRPGNDIQSKVMAFAFGLSAEIERNLISQQTKASLESVRASGKRLGRPLSAQSKKLKLSKNTKKIKEMLDVGQTRYRIAKVMGVKPSTVNHFIDRMGW